MEYQWFYKNKGEDKKVWNLAKELNISIPNAHLLVQRNIHTFEEAKNYFRPQLKDLHDPFLMKDMEIAVKRLTTAISENQKVLIYGDYDVDGTSSVALMYSFLKKITQKIDYYVPDRDSEGYGISFKGVDYAKKNNCKLVIALDCGIKANEKIDYANQLGIDFIICDHHLPSNELPKATAILDPKQKDCSYPDKNLSGCGVGFKLVQAFAERNNIPVEDTYSLLDLVVVSIASDIVPIIGENRILAFYGLKILNSNPRVGLQSLIEIANLKNKEIEINDIVFKIGPRINAAGRLKTAKYSVDLLIEQDYTNAKEEVSAIDIINTKRRDLDIGITKEAIEIINNNTQLLHKNTTVLCNTKWHKGVLGIVASRLVEQFYRPTIILTESEDELLTGSARSVKGFNIYEAIDHCSNLLEGYGGHMYAAGLNLKKENLESFQNKFEEFVSNKITKDLLIPKIEIDLKIKLSDIDQKFYNIIKQMAPFGPNNMKPVFVMDKLHDSGYSKIVGKDASHLKLSVMQKNNNITIDGIAFGKSEYYKIINKEPFAICFNLSENHFQGKTSLQADIKEIQKCKGDN